MLPAMFKLSARSLAACRSISLDPAFGLKVSFQEGPDDAVNPVW